ncbi:MAG TPA: OmpA family protein [Puia sp.]|nr:OmpA family protein [Puia sp.]
MRTIFAFLLACFIQCPGTHAQLLKKMTDKVNQNVNTQVDNMTGQVSGKQSNKSSGSSADSSSPSTIKSYSNYDFLPGDTILFEDNFSDDQDGEFPAHWQLLSGQGVINKINGEPALMLTEGNFVRVSPRMKPEKNYIPSNFTIEFDFFANAGYFPPMVMFQFEEGKEKNIEFGKEVKTYYFSNDFDANYPGDRDNFADNWHHAAMVKKGSQIKCYIDQYRVLVIPDCGIFQPLSLQMGGVADDKNHIIFKNFRFASGGGMNMIGKAFTEAKIITHGINFDIDKASLKPESMGTLNMIVRVMNNNPGLKFEVDGHTDNSGSPAHNLTLSQQRADAVKDQLVKMGIDPSMLTAKGFGDSKPVSDNNTAEGRANNRRVEFVKIK